MGLVDHQQGHAGVGHRPQEGAGAEALGGHVEQGQGAGAGALEHAPLGLLGHLRVQRRGGDPGPLQPGELVGHQRDERRDHHRQPGRRRGGRLVAERLARAGGHHDQGVAPGEGGGDGAVLAGAQAPHAQAPEDGVEGLPRRAARRGARLVEQPGDQAAQQAAVVGPQPRPGGPQLGQLALDVAAAVEAPREPRQRAQGQDRARDLARGGRGGLGGRRGHPRRVARAPDGRRVPARPRHTSGPILVPRAAA